MKNNAIFVFAACFFVAPLIIFFAIVYRASAPVTSQDWASWAQAASTVLAIQASAAIALAVPIIMRRIEANEAKQDALDAALEMGRWAHAATAQRNQFGYWPLQREAGMRAQITMAEHRLSEIHLPTLRSPSTSRRLRQVQRLARAMVEGLPQHGYMDPGAEQFLRNCSNQLTGAILDLARLIEARPEMTREQIIQRLDLV